MINNVKIKDQGTTNEWKKTKYSKYVQLTVFGKIQTAHSRIIYNFTIPTSSVFITHLQDQFIHINEDAVFECVVNGSESLTISWRRNVNGGRRSILKVKKPRITDI